MKPLPTFFISHGGGPWPYLQGEMRELHAQLEKSLQDIPKQLAIAPQAILMVSAHWEEKDFTVMANPNPPMLYDYGGFPAHTYQVHYRAPGSPELAQKVKSLIERAGFAAKLDLDRGYDHGAFTPLEAMYPDAKIPVVQLSIRRDYQPEAHLKLGQALASLRNEGVLIVGSGLSYHNLRNFNEGARVASRAFDDWLTQTLNETPPNERAELLKQWAKAPSARAAHPREDHLVPLFVALGAAHSEASTSIYHQNDFFGGITVSSFRFGDI